jgi:hypothetical protein
MIDNPYLKEYKKIAVDDVSPALSFIIQYEKRKELVRQFSWAIPDEQVLMTIKSHANKIVEIGAGTGYWAFCLEQIGVDCICFDESPYDNHWCDAMWFNVFDGNEYSVAKHSDRALFLCWPPYDDEMAYNALMNYRGDKLIYIGEGYGGCTGSDTFHQELEKRWEEIEYNEILRYDTINDAMWIYERKMK